MKLSDALDKHPNNGIVSRAHDLSTYFPVLRKYHEYQVSYLKEIWGSEKKVECKKESIAMTQK
jgi:hypothetical protein